VLISPWLEKRLDSKRDEPLLDLLWNASNKLFVSTVVFCDNSAPSHCTRNRSWPIALVDIPCICTYKGYQVSFEFSARHDVEAELVSCRIQIKFEDQIAIAKRSQSSSCYSQILKILRMCGGPQAQVTKLECFVSSDMFTYIHLPEVAGFGRPKQERSRVSDVDIFTPWSFLPNLFPSLCFSHKKHRFHRFFQNYVFKLNISYRLKCWTKLRCCHRLVRIYKLYIS
jgi:hypothetical protein